MNEDEQTFMKNMVAHHPDQVLNLIPDWRIWDYISKKVGERFMLQDASKIVEPPQHTVSASLEYVSDDEEDYNDEPMDEDLEPGTHMFSNPSISVEGDQELEEYYDEPGPEDMVE